MIIQADSIERTGYQLSNRASVSNNMHGDYLDDSEQNGNWYKLVREIRRNPTIALVRNLFAAPALVAGWSIKTKQNSPIGAEDTIDAAMMPHMKKLVRCAMLSNIDFGWSIFEKVFKVNEDFTAGIRKFKQLLHDHTDIMVIKETGEYAGAYQEPEDDKEGVFLDTTKAMLFNYDVEGTNWYGSAIMRNLEGTYNDRKKTSKASVRHDEKIAGTHWVIHYPKGTTEVDGQIIDNFVLAQRIRGELQSSGCLIIPKALESVVRDLNDDIGTDTAWHIELLSASGDASGSYIQKLEYYDKLFVRGLLLPERAVTEGKHGTKAEAAEHIDVGLATIELMHDDVLDTINKDVVNQLLFLNYGAGAEDTVIIEANPLVDEKKKQIKELYSQLLSDPAFLMDEAAQVDTREFKEILGIPVIEQQQLVFEV